MHDLTITDKITGVGNGDDGLEYDRQNNERRKMTFV